MKNELTTTEHNKQFQFTKILRDVSNATSLKNSELSEIIRCNNNSIRKELQSGDSERIAICRAQIKQMIHTVVVLYTSANFDKQDKTTTDILMTESANFVLKNYPMFNPSEIKTAFEFASAKKTNADISTYYGKFTIQMLGEVLNAYFRLRQNAIARIDKKVEIEHNRQRKEDADAKNKQTIQDVVDLYGALREQYQNTGEFDEQKVKSFQGKILVDAGLITFTRDEKIQIYNEAKDTVTKQIKTGVQDMNLKSTERRTLKSMLTDIVNGDEKDDFKSRVNSQYSILLIKKSIIA